MNLAKRVLAIKESPTIAMMTKAQIMRAGGQDVVILAAGEPDFATPNHIKAAAIAAIEANQTKYTAVGGTPELKHAIVGKFKRENNLDYNVSQILVSCGAKHSIYNALQALIGAGDEVIIPAPYWVSYLDMVLLADGVPRSIVCSKNTQYKLTSELLEQNISAKTKALIINSPCNPTGMIYSADELAGIAEVLRRHPQVYVISDDIYEHILFPGSKFTNILNVAPDLSQRVIVVNGMSKAYAMTGWRIGFAACSDASIIKAMDTIQSQVTSNPCSISQAAAYKALTSGLDCVKPMCEAFSMRHDYVVDRLNKMPGISCLRAAGAFYAFFDCERVQEQCFAAGKIKANTDLALANYLLENFLVAGVPGSSFGLDNHMRISFATSMEELTRGLDRIEASVKA